MKESAGRGQEHIAGSASLCLADGVPLLHPEDQVFEAMLRGWRNQQMARNLAPSTVNSHEHQVRAFMRNADAYPWLWSSSLADEWFSDLRSVRHVGRSTVRSYQVAIRGFCAFTDRLADRTARPASLPLAA
jgi:integrase/recombinase XerC